MVELSRNLAPRTFDDSVTRSQPNCRYQDPQWVALS